MTIRASVPLVLALVSCGCAVRTVDGERHRVGSDAFRAYVEQVFREQNRIATDLAFAIEGAAAGSARRRALEAAESALLEACAELNTLAAARRDGERLGTVAKAGAARTAPDCERAARAAEEVLETG